ncbi:MAG TPA: hypothetical protein DCM71_15945 [Runella sp.]|nr:hypothetical protein [Runella sp.]
MNKGICKLCLKEKKLLKKSHIIPDFMYQKLYGSEHKLEVFTNKSLEQNNSKDIKRPSSGEYESNILCQECDNRILSEYESYASKVLFTGNISNPQGNPIVKKYLSLDNVRYAVLSNVDYRKFKLFLLSILWKSSISSRLFFREVNLNHYEEVIRKMLLNNDPGDELDFPITISHYWGHEDLRIDWILQPRRFIDNNVEVFLFPINGIILKFHLVLQSKEEVFLDLVPKKNNTICMISLPKESMYDFIFKYTNIV